MLYIIYIIISHLKIRISWPVLENIKMTILLQSKGGSWWVIYEWMSSQICIAFYFFKVFSHWDLGEVWGLLKKGSVSHILSLESCTSVVSSSPSFQDCNEDLLSIRYLYTGNQLAEFICSRIRAYSFVCDISLYPSPLSSCNSAELHKRSFLIAILKFFNIHSLQVKTFF